MSPEFEYHVCPISYAPNLPGQVLTQPSGAPSDIKKSQASTEDVPLNNAVINPKVPLQIVGVKVGVGVGEIPGVSVGVGEGVVVTCIVGV